MDPITSLCGAIVAICSLAEKVLDTIPQSVHEQNWERWMKFVDAIDKVSERIRSLEPPQEP